MTAARMPIVTRSNTHRRLLRSGPKISSRTMKAAVSLLRYFSVSSLVGARATYVVGEVAWRSNIEDNTYTRNGGSAHEEDASRDAGENRQAKCKYGCRSGQTY